MGAARVVEDQKGAQMDPTWVISIIAIVIVAVIAWRVFERRRDR